VSRLYLERLCSPLGQGSNTATWLIVRDVGQRTEHDVRALGRATSTFIVERTCRLSTLLTGDVPPRHLLRPVHFAGRRCQGHPADGAPVQSVAETVRPCCAMHCTHPLYEKLRLARRGYTDLGCQGARRSLQQQVLVATSTMFQGPHVGAQYSCTCPPLAIKGEACDVTTQAQSLGLDPSHPRQIKLSSNITHSGVGYYALAARTTLNSCVFLCSSVHLTTSKTLRPLLILGFRAGALCHPDGDFLSDIWRAR
jgi:hypothetical protein